MLIILLKTLSLKFSWLSFYVYFYNDYEKKYNIARHDDITIIIILYYHLSSFVEQWRVMHQNHNPEADGAETCLKKTYL